MAEKMISEIHCPRCAKPIDPQARFCKHCGVDLALAAVLLERDVTVPQEVQIEGQIAPELLVPRLGDYMIENGIIKEQDLQQALSFQKERANQGKSILIGQALLELGLIDRETLDQVITKQILQLQFVLSETNRRLEKRVQERTRDLQQALDRLAELNQLKSNFLANISHELRTPLTHIKGYVDLMVVGGMGPLSAEQMEAMDVIQRAEARLERLIEDLIQFSLAAQGELSIILQPFDLNKLIDRVVTAMKQKARIRQISLITHLSPHLPAVQADEEKINWVLMHLLDNALKFTQQGGEVQINTLVDGNTARVAVVDNGIGIPKERLFEIFEPFHQLDSSSTRKFGGTGLGLAMVRRILDGHRTQIEAHSIVGKGSRFEFSLPFATKTVLDKNGDHKDRSLNQTKW
jgi:signal transduction histidine kinase